MNQEISKYKRKLDQEATLMFFAQSTNKRDVLLPSKG